MGFFDTIGALASSTKAHLGIAGSLGGLVRWLALSERPQRGIISIIVGGLCAIYLSPLVGPLIDPVIRVAISDPVSRADFAGFVVGLSGIGAARFIMGILSRRARDIEAQDDDEPPKP